jgi:CRISPR-associated endonuclease Csn1
MAAPQQPYILGLDLGVQSVGWAMLDLDGDGHPCGIRRSGVRCFDSGVGSETEIASGKDESQNIKRRQMRLQRRQLWRRGRRLKKIFLVLQKAGLLPPGETRTSQQRHELLRKLDAELARAYLPEHDRVAGHLLQYRLRALALDQSLPPFAFGRALFHLAQRRGFLSNRKSVSKDGDDEGAVKAGIAELQQRIQEAGVRTLGEYFSTLDPEAEKQRIRRRWTARSMYLDEFEKIWIAQLPHHPNLNAEWKEWIHDAIFHQRPLKSQKRLVGMCELEPTCRRAPRASVEAQQFRYLQKVNDLEISTPSGEIWAMIDPEQADLRRNLIELLDTHAEIEFRSLRSKLGLKKPKGSDADYAFNLEAGGEKRLKGNATAVKLRKVLGNDYEKLSPEQVADAVEDLLEYEKKDALALRLTRRYGIAPAKADELADVTLEPNYASLSREAMRKLLPLMEKGLRFAEAKKQVYGTYMGRSGLRDSLPPVLDAVQLRNPVVCRGLTELRKVVNALVRQYGKPELIRIELARDLKKSRQQREDLTKQNRDNEKSRNVARGKIAERLRCDDNSVSNLDILKVRLAEECNWECPYTGKSIAIEALVGRHSQFDIEHIIPFSRSLDNSFLNKTLCYHEENRDVKKNQTPYEAYSGDETKWQGILARIRRFRGSAGHAKLRKFQQQKPDEDFATRMLQDTRYMSRLATEYLGLLYGGTIDADGRQRVQVSAGRITAYLRDEWGLNAILADGNENEKNRDDHRHHAVDATVIALTDNKTVAMLSHSAKMAAERGHRLFALNEIEKPWPTFLDDIRRAIDVINISYRVNRRVTGALHEETNYSKPHKSRDGDGRNGKEVEYRHVRKPLQNMSANEVENIVDDTIRTLVQAKLKLIGGEPKKVFADPGNHPYLTAKDGRHIFIHKARIRKPVAVIPLGKSSSPRYVAPGSNHHMEIFAVLDSEGKERTWDSVIVNLFQAHRRVSAAEPVIQRGHGQNTTFKFSLAGGEYVEMDNNSGGRSLYRVTVISGNQIEFRLHTDARPITILKKIQGARVRCSPSALMRAKARKVVVDPMGNILPAND